MPPIDAHLEPLRQLRPPTFAQLAAAKRAGRDPNELLEQFNAEYGAATAEATRRINAALGSDHEVTDEYRRLWDVVNAYAEERYEAWWIAPRRALAKVLNPQATPGD